MIKKEIGYAYNDITLVPTIISDVKSRSEIKSGWVSIISIKLEISFKSHNTNLDNDFVLP